jgi:hypothetical protein
MKRIVIVAAMALGLLSLAACTYEDPQPPFCIPESGMCGVE